MNQTNRTGASLPAREWRLGARCEFLQVKIDSRKSFVICILLTDLDARKIRSLKDGEVRLNEIASAMAMSLDGVASQLWLVMPTTWHIRSGDPNPILRHLQIVSISAACTSPVST